MVQLPPQSRQLAQTVRFDTVSTVSKRFENRIDPLLPLPRVNNFSKDVADGENYTVLLNQLKPDECSRAPLQERDLHARAEKVSFSRISSHCRLTDSSLVSQVLQNADAIGCRKYLTPTSLVAGNAKLNLAFVANLFNTHPGLEPLEENERPVIEDFDAEGEREARVFTLWLNSLDVDPGVYDLFEDLKVSFRYFLSCVGGSLLTMRNDFPGWSRTPSSFRQGRSRIRRLASSRENPSSPLSLQGCRKHQLLSRSRTTKSHAHRRYSRSRSRRRPKNSHSRSRLANDAKEHSLDDGGP